jgi:hypothetical protein
MGPPPVSGGVGERRRTAVLHLVWAPLGVEPLSAFLASCRAHPAEEDHEVVILLNGTQLVGAADLGKLRGELADTEHRLIELPRPVLDLAAYAYAVSMIDHQFVCILNSYSRPRADGWLRMLGSALRRPGVGIVGASGSWASHNSYARFHLGLPSPYRAVYRNRAQTIAAFAAIETERSGIQPAGGALAKIGTARALLGSIASSPSFPATHLRTNAFMAARELLSWALPQSLSNKAGAHRVEGGRRSITRRVQATGLGVRVVDRRGEAFEPEDWPESDTFWHGDQERLLIADNQSETYEQGSYERRLLLSRLAWGQRADAGAVPSR